MFSFNEMPDYPTGNKLHFAKYFNSRYNYEVDIEYLPINMDSMFINYNYRADIENYLSNLNPLKTYFLIGGMSKYKIPPNVIYFSAGYEGVAIPYLCDMLPVSIDKTNKLYYSGSPTFNRIGLDKYNGKFLDRQEYFDNLAKSKFALCPEGADSSSYRLYEAIHCECIPIYISDNYILPFGDIIDYSKLIIKLAWKDISLIDEITNSNIELNIKDFKHYFTPEFTYNYIINYLKNVSIPRL